MGALAKYIVFASSNLVLIKLGLYEETPLFCRVTSHWSGIWRPWLMSYTVRCTTSRRRSYEPFATGKASNKNKC